VARAAIAEFLLSLMYVTGKAGRMMGEAALYALRVELMTGGAFGLVRVTTHLLRVEMRLVRKAGTITANAFYPEFIQARWIADQQA
jgi:hypothetical protein